MPRQARPPLLIAVLHRRSASWSRRPCSSRSSRRPPPTSARATCRSWSPARRRPPTRSPPSCAARAGRVRDHPRAGRGRRRRDPARPRGLRGVRRRPGRPGRAHRERRQPHRGPARRPGRGRDERRRSPTWSPGSPDDPRGAGFAAGFLPLALTALAAGAALALLVRARWARFAGVLVFGVAGRRWSAPLVLQQWLGVLDRRLPAQRRRDRAVRDRRRRHAWPGSARSLGRPGIGLGVLAVFLVGNPLSAVSAAPGAAAPAVGRDRPVPADRGRRLAAALDRVLRRRGRRRPAWVLAAYAVVGLLLALVGGVRDPPGRPRRTDRGAAWRPRPERRPVNKGPFLCGKRWEGALPYCPGDFVHRRSHACVTAIQQLILDFRSAR